MKRYNDYRTSKRTVEVHDLSFLSDPTHHYGWLRRHYRHHKLRRALKKAELIIAHNPKVVTDLRRYYFVPKERVTMSSSGKARDHRLYTTLNGTINVVGGCGPVAPNDTIRCADPAAVPDTAKYAEVPDPIIL